MTLKELYRNKCEQIADKVLTQRGIKSFADWQEATAGISDRINHHISVNELIEEYIKLSEYHTDLVLHVIAYTENYRAYTLQEVLENQTFEERARSIAFWAMVADVWDSITMYLQQSSSREESTNN